MAAKEKEMAGNQKREKRVKLEQSIRRKIIDKRVCHEIMAPKERRENKDSKAEKTINLRQKRGRKIIEHKMGDNETKKMENGEQGSKKKWGERKKKDAMPCSKKGRKGIKIEQNKNL